MLTILRFVFYIWNFKYKIFATKRTSLEKKAIYKIFPFSFQKHVSIEIQCVIAEKRVIIILYGRATSNLK
jgi:hypothetical protein